MKKTILNYVSNPKYISLIYIFAAIFCANSKYLRGPLAYNNYLIFKNVFFNTINFSNLYGEYPEKYLDVNHYGIFFSDIIAPFAILPDWLGMILWNVFNALVFLFAIKKLPFSAPYKSFFAWLCLQEFITASLSFQFNIALAGLIILSAIYVYEKKETQSVIAMLVGTFVKIYGIVGLSQFFFVKNKKKFIIAFAGVFILFFCLPMLYSSAEFVINSYSDWFKELVHKNNINGELNDSTISNLYFYAVGLPLFALPYIRINQYKNLAFRMMILSSTLVFLVLFSSSSESPTYIIAVSGVMLWFLMQKEKNALVISLLVFVLLFTCFSNSDLFPRYVKDHFIIKYSIKSLPCSIVWIRITYELLTKDFEKDYTLYQS